MVNWTLHDIVRRATQVWQSSYASKAPPQEMNAGPEDASGAPDDTFKVSLYADVTDQGEEDDDEELDRSVVHDVFDERFFPSLGVLDSRRPALRDNDINQAVIALRDRYFLSRVHDYMRRLLSDEAGSLAAQNGLTVHPEHVAFFSARFAGRHQFYESGAVSLAAILE
jgi:hypothetical protein